MESLKLKHYKDYEEFPKSIEYRTQSFNTKYDLEKTKKEKKNSLNKKKTYSVSQEKFRS